MRTLLLFVLATLVVIGLITGLFLGNLRQNQRESIVLPDAAQSAQTGEQPPDQPEAALLDVTRENVRDQLAQIKDFPILGGTTVTFSEEGYVNLQYVTVTIRDGQWVPYK